jgi:hypothetical protein
MRTERLNFFEAKALRGPPAIWGAILLVDTAILISGCCQEADTECDCDREGESSGG